MSSNLDIQNLCDNSLRDLFSIENWGKKKKDKAN
jgi:hypothetical protein